jgi:hypothetical protein
MSAMRIIDRDVEFYKAAVEEEQRRLRSCPQSKERYHQARLRITFDVLFDLMRLRDMFDAAEPPTPEADLCDRD